MLRHLDRVRVRTPDPSAAAAHYARLLGASVAAEGESRTLAVGGTRLELAPQGAEAHSGGIEALVFAGEDLDACARWLDERGLATRPVERGASRRALALDLKATRGIPIELVEASGPERTAAAEPVALDVRPVGAVAEALDHVVVMTPDHAAAISLYGDGLGLRLALDRSFPERSVRLLFFRIAGVTVEVGGPLEALAEPAPHDRFYGLAWRGPDLRGWRKRLLDEGFDVSGERSGNKQGTRVCTVKSRTAGVPTLLIGPDPDIDPDPDSDA